MNNKFKIKIISGSIAILLFVVIGIYSYLQLSGREKSLDTNLFSLVPESCIAIMETNNLSELMHHIDKARFAAQYDSLRISDLLLFLKKNMDLLAANKAHGLSKQMNQMLISIHGTENTRDQVLYGKLAAEDRGVIESLIKRNCSSPFPDKTFEYKGEQIHIYPISNNDFLACYFQPGFYVISYQKRLIEEVIDAYTERKSILSDEVFKHFISEKKTYSSASIYLKSQHIPIGKEPKKEHFMHLSRWTAFNLSMKEDAIYLSGSFLDTDSCLSFQNTLRGQKSIEIFPASSLPDHISYFYQMSISDIEKTVRFMASQKQPVKGNIESIKKNDSLIYNFIKENAKEELRFFMFRDDSSTASPIRKVMSIQIKDNSSAENRLNALLRDIDNNGKSYAYSSRTLSSGGKNHKIFTIPQSSVFSQFSSNPKHTAQTYGCFYEGNLLVCPNDSSIYLYIKKIETGKSMAGNPLYEKCISSLSSESNYLTIADMGDMALYPEVYKSLIPQFFFKHQQFFRNFILTIQFTCVNQKTYPYLVFIYRGKGKDQKFTSIPSNAKCI